MTRSAVGWCCGLILCVSGFVVQPEAMQEGYLRITRASRIRAPRIVKMVEPVIPVGIKPYGEVWMDLLISKTGQVELVILLRGVRPPNAALDEAAIEAKRQTIYQPTIVGGVAYPLRMRVTINYTRWMARLGTPQR